MNKKLLALLLVLAMTVSLAACSKDQEGTPDTQQPPVEDTQMPENSGAETVEPESPDNDTDDTADQPQEIPEGEDDAFGNLNTDSSPQETVAPEAKPEAKPETQKPAEKPTEKPEVKPDAAPEAPSAGKVDLAAFYETALTKGEWPAMGPMEGEALDAFYPGLTAIGANQCIVSMAMMGSVVAEIALVEVQTTAEAEAVKAIFQARINYQVGDETNPGGAWYPESIEGWKNDSRVVVNGNYIMMVAHSAADEVVSAFEALFA